MIEGGAPARVRPLQWSDYAAAAAVWAAAGRDIPERGELAGLLQRGPGLALVAEVGTAAAGVVLGTYDGRRGWILRLAVSPEHRRRGLATLLVAELERAFQRLGCPRVNLLVLPDNADGLAFWRALGYLPAPDVLCTKPLRPAAR